MASKKVTPGALKAMASKAKPKTCMPKSGVQGSKPPIKVPRVTKPQKGMKGR